MKPRTHLISLLLLAILINSCNGEETQLEPTPLTLKSTSVVSATPQIASPTPAPTEQKSITSLAIKDLAGRLGVPTSEIEVVSEEAVEWSDASLGCPEPEMMYAQVITPGYRIELSVAEQRFEYHTDDRQSIILCGNQEKVEKTPQAGSIDPGAELLITLALEDLAERLAIGVRQIEVLEAKSVVWSDTSLGCPESGMMYAQVTTPGYRVILEARGEAYWYHTDNWELVIRCGEDGMWILPPIPIRPGEKIQDGEPWIPVD